MRSGKMYRIQAAAAQFKQDEKGAAAFEYGFTAALLAVVLILSASLLGGSVNAMFGSVASSFSTGPFGANAVSSGQVPAAGPSSGGSFCQKPTQPSLLASPGAPCQPSACPAVTVGNPAVAG